MKMNASIYLSQLNLALVFAGLLSQAAAQYDDWKHSGSTYLVTDSAGADLPGGSEKVEGFMRHATAVASTRGHMILGPDAFFDDKIFDFTPEN